MRRQANKRLQWGAAAFCGIAILIAITLGGTPIGAPIVGWVADHFGPRWALGVGAASGFAAALVAVRLVMKQAESMPENEPRPI